MLGSVCFYNNQIFAADANGNLIAYKYLKFPKKVDQNFKENLRLKIPLPEPFHIKDIVLDAVDNYSLSLKCLIVVAISLYGDISVHLFCPNIKNTLINVNTSDWFPLLNVQPNCNFFISHGPTLLFSSPQEIFLCNLQYKTSSKFNSHISDNFNSNKIIQFTSIGRLNVKKPVDVLLLIHSYETSAGSKMIHASSFGMKVKQKDSPLIHHDVLIHHFFPTHFQNSVEMIYVWNISIDELQDCNLENVKWKYNSSFLCTKTGSFLFCNGILKYIFEKPGLNISYIITEFYEVSFSSLKLIVASTSKDIYFVIGKDSNPSLQLIKTWKNIETVLCGDILMNGSKHLLLLKNTSCDNWQDDCILSDISDFVPVDYVTLSKEVECSINRAMPGIQAKILAGKSAITNTKSNIEEKMEATLESLHKLNASTVVDAQIDHHISSFRETLVDIILSKDEVNKSRKDDEKAVKLIIQKHWKQLFNNYCVLCWSFSNADDRTIFNPVLNMWISDQHIQCFQRVTVHKSQILSVDDEIRKEINPKENFMVTVSFEIPEFSCENVEIHAVLSWYIGSNAEFENELYLPLKEKMLTQQQMSLQTNMSSDEIFTSVLTDISTYEDLMCVKILQQRIVFIILSLKTDLCNFEDIVMSSSSNSLLLLMSSGSKMLVFNKANHPLYGAHIAFKAVSQASVEVEVFTKNEKETALVEKYLYQRLPSDILILANGISTNESIQLKQQALCCMKDELDLLLSMLNIHNVPGPSEKFVVQPGAVVISKENFLRIRKALLKKESRTDNVMQILSRINFFRKNE